MIENGTKVKVNMTNGNNKAVIHLLNAIGGEVVLALGDKRSRIGYLVAYDKKHLDKIERARELDEKNHAGIMFFNLLGKSRPKEFPGDPRYYLLAFESELQAA